MNLTHLPALALSALVQRRAVSCHEVMAAYLDHIGRLNPAVNAIVSAQPRDVLLAKAAAADAALAQGQSQGWMHGLPHAVKDLAATHDMPSTQGSPLFATARPPDAIFVERLRAAGAILIGKTNVPEFGLGSQTYNSVFGPTGNAYDPDRTAGGSSGGAAAALALRMVPVADGSDFAGSLRNPAGWNNVFGFRPTAGVVPYGPATELYLSSLGVEGPMARHVTDLAALLSVMAGYDARAPASLGGDPARFARPLGRDFTGVRIGWLGDLGGIPTAPGMIELCLHGLTRLTSAGAVIEPARLGIGRDAIWQCFTTLRHGLIAGKLMPLYADPARRALMKPEAVWEVEGGLRLSALDFYNASVRRSAVSQAFRVSLAQYDFLALPSAQVFPFDKARHWPDEIAGVTMDSYHRWMEIVAGPTLAGLPVAAVPAGFGAEGLPSGLQLIGRSGDDFGVLQLAYAYEQVSAEVLQRMPPLLAGP